MDGVVIGILKKDGTVDVPRVARLVELARPMQVTFHRAFDMTADPYQALEDIRSIEGIRRILTSGHDKTALDGLPEITELIRRSGSRPIIVPGGGITERNAQRIVRESGATEVRGSPPLSCHLHQIFQVLILCPKPSPLASPVRENQVQQRHGVQELGRHHGRAIRAPRIFGGCG